MKKCQVKNDLKTSSVTEPTDAFPIVVLIFIYIIAMSISHQLRKAGLNVIESTVHVMIYIKMVIQMLKRIWLNRWKSFPSPRNSFPNDLLNKMKNNYHVISVLGKMSIELARNFSSSFVNGYLT